MNAPNKHFSFGKLILFSVAAVLIGAFVFVYFTKIYPARREAAIASSNNCISNLRLLDVAKNQWALEHHAKDGGMVAMSQITNYMPHGIICKCPSGGVYTIEAVGVTPTCSLGDKVFPAHILP